MPTRDRAIYRIIFHNQGKIYEIYARDVQQGAMFSFVEVADLIFGEKSSVVVDPSEENLKSEFSHVARTYIPLHAIIRIDEVDRQGTSKVTEAGGRTGNVMPFPVYTHGGDDHK